MRTKRMNLLILAAMTFAVGTLIATDVLAELRVSAVVRTPVASIRVGNGPVGYRAVRQVRPLPARGRIYRTVRLDIEIANRLAWYTGVPQGELLRYRRFGYDWYEIGQWLYVPGRVVRAAMSERHWNRFLHQGGYHAEFYGGRKHRERGDRYCDVYEYRR